MAKVRILLVEDEKDLAYILRSNFKKEGFDVLIAHTAEIGLRLARGKKPDLIVSDIMLPKMDGLEMVRQLRKEMQVPVLFLTARKDEVDRVMGLELGGDDYISKPFSTRELICRIRAVLRRANQKSSPDGQATLRIGGIEIDQSRHEVRVNGKFRNLTPRELQLLTILAEANGKVLSRDHLLKRVWGYDKSMAIDTRTVDQHISRLRRNLLSEKRRIATIKNSGYTLRRS